MSDVPLRDYVDRLFMEQEKHIARSLQALNEAHHDNQAKQSQTVAWVGVILGVFNMILWFYVILHK